MKLFKLMIALVGLGLMISLPGCSGPSGGTTDTPVPPAITAIDFAATLRPGQSTDVTVTIAGNDGDSLSYAFTADGGNGTFWPATGTIDLLGTTTASFTVVYTAPAATGSFTHSVDVTGTEGSASDSIAIDVTGTPLEFNISDLSIPSSIQTNTTVTMLVSVAAPVGTTLNYEIFGGGGTFSPSNGAITVASTSEFVSSAYTAPTTPGTYVHGIRIGNTAGEFTQVSFETVVDSLASGGIAITNVSIPSNLTVNSTNTLSFDVTGPSNATVNFQILGGGGSFNSTSGSIVLSGTQGTISVNYTAPATAGMYTHGIRVTEGVTGVDAVTFTTDVVSITQASIISITAPPSVEVAQTGLVQFDVAGADSDTLTYSIVAASGGGTFDVTTGTVTLSGQLGSFTAIYTAPDIAGTYTHVVTVTDTLNRTHTRNFDVVVSPSSVPVIAAISVPATVDTGATDNVMFTISGPQGATFNYTIVPGTSGGTFNPASGSFTLLDPTHMLTVPYTGPLTAGTYTHSITVTDSLSNSVQANFDTVVVPAPIFPGISSITAPTRMQINGVVDIVLAVTGTPDTTLTYSLSTGGGYYFNGYGTVLLDSTGNGTITDQFYAPSYTGLTNHTASVWDANSVTVNQNFTVDIVNNTPTGVSVIFAPVIVNIGASQDGTNLILTATIDDAGPASELTYLWSFTGSQAFEVNSVNSVNPARLLGSAFDFVGDVSLTVTNQNGTGASSTTTFSLSLSDYSQTIIIGIPIATAPVTWSTLGAGASQSFATLSDGSLWAWGYNNQSQLGLGDLINRSQPTRVASDVTPWSRIIGGAFHTLALRNDGTLWSWGDNAYGQLGDGSTIDRTLPTRVNSDRDWVDIAAADNSSYALKSDGSLWVWGNNSYGELGLGDTTNRSRPVRITGSKTWSKIVAGSRHALAIHIDGTLWAWGNGSGGELGQGSVTSYPYPVQVGIDTSWTDIAAGTYVSLGLQGGSLFAWGYGAYGTLGQGNILDSTAPVAVSAGITDWSGISLEMYHVLALRSDGSLYAWGQNNYGQLGQGNTTQLSLATQVGVDMDWAGVSAGGYHSLAIKNDGTLYSWGQNSSGQLGLGDTTIRNVPTPVPSNAGGWTVDMKDTGTYRNDFESIDMQGWTATGTWAVTNEDAHSGTNSVTDSPGGNYGNYANMSLTSPIIDFSGRTAATLSFFHKYVTESSYDRGRLDISQDGGQTFTEISNWGGTISAWVEASVDLTPYLGSQVVIRFRFTSDGSVVYDGWHIDDITIS